MAKALTRTAAYERARPKAATFGARTSVPRKVVEVFSQWLASIDVDENGERSDNSGVFAPSPSDRQTLARCDPFRGGSFFNRWLETRRLSASGGVSRRSAHFI
jgi:hypothetical protein